MSKADLRDLFARKYGTKHGERVSTDVPAPTDFVIPERAFVLQAESGRTVITAPMREVAAANDGFTYIRGRLVGADQPNDNGAFWTTEDLQLGESSVAGGPVNWIHDDTHNIGCLLEGHLVTGREAAASGVGNHIATTAAIWRFLYPREADTIEKAALDGQLFFSMECISREVACMDGPGGRRGCGETFSYKDADSGNCCSHIREKSSMRRFIDPLFLGTAVIVPPVMPAWRSASADVVRQAAATAETSALADSHLSRSQAEDVAHAVLTWANRAA